MTDIIRLCDVIDDCADCPRYADDCDGRGGGGMTKEEAMKWLKRCAFSTCEECECEVMPIEWCDQKMQEAVMAITETEPTDTDLISRADAIEAVAKLDRYDVDERNRLRAYTPFHGAEAQTFIDVIDLYQALEALPSADKMRLGRCKTISTLMASRGTMMGRK